MQVIGCLQQADAIHALECAAIALVNLAATVNGIFDMAQLQHPEGRLQLVHLAIDAGCHDGDFIGKAEVLQVVDAAFELFVLTDDGPAFNGVEHFGGVETEDRKVAMVEDAGAVLAYAEGMGGIVDDLKAISVGNLLDAFDIAGYSIAVHRQDRRGRWRDGLDDALRVEVVGARVDVDEHRLEVVPQQRVGGGYE
ncbi:hypothetical protein D3C79_752380 [compost metagenome]